MKTTAAVLGLALLAAACTEPPKGLKPVAGIREATPAEVSACTYVSDFRIKPSVYGLLADEGVKYARNTLMSDARDAGANTVVFDPVSPGTEVYELHAVAYRC